MGILPADLSKSEVADLSKSAKWGGILPADLSKSKVADLSKFANWGGDSASRLSKSAQFEQILFIRLIGE